MRIFLHSALYSLLLGAASTAWATNGYSPHGFGTRSKGMAGVGVALPQEVLSSATNPALMPMVGNRLELGLSLFSPRRSYTADDNGFPIGPPMGPATILPGTYDSDKTVFFVPHIGYNRLLDERQSLGLALSGNGGMNTEYPYAVFAPFNNPMGTASQPTGVNLGQVFLGIPYGIRLTPEHSIGVMPIVAVQWFESYGLEPFKPFSNAPDHLTNHGHDFSYGGGVRVGWLGQFNEKWSLGASYQSQLYMSEFDDYRGLFAQNGDFDVPPTWTIGAAFHATPDLTFALDVQQIYYSKVDAIANRSDVPFMPGSVLLGTEQGLGFGWDDMTIVKMGVEWRYRPELQFRAGYARANQAIPGSQALFNILAPATLQHHYTLGLTYAFPEWNSDVNIAVMYSPTQQVKGQNPNTGPQTGSIQMRQFEIEVNWGWNF
ncbi:OmpP1/FadL family transporter [Thioflexithrix psekupsensis]|uniref:Transporter n=1 Tax=Thioflexithrix psekupsensis TaxID=1570016 RepID=A0A251X430_9GAMM|nr:outer membrane protein transport protein [Thioflexithrix psekupsensis]OUD12253.1 transporter [Thioflexithrix psekupsensis]